MIERYPFLGVILDHINGDNAVNCIEYFIEQKRSARVYFLNAHCYNLSTTIKDYQVVLNASELVLPDGVGVLWAAKRLGLPHRENLNGTDFIPRLCDELPKRRGNLKIFLLGGQPGIAEQAGQKLALKHAGVTIVGTQHGFFQPDQNNAIIANINRLEPDIVLVAMGVPRQEIWIHENAAELKTGAIFAVGGLFDFLSERLPRAPMSIRKIKLEWAWRLLQEPTRLWTRYIVGNPLYISRVAAGILRHKRSEPTYILTVPDSVQGAKRNLE